MITMRHLIKKANTMTTTFNKSNSPIVKIIPIKIANIKTASITRVSPAKEVAAIRTTTIIINKEIIITVGVVIIIITRNLENTQAIEITPILQTPILIQTITPTLVLIIQLLVVMQGKATTKAITTIIIAAVKTKLRTIKENIRTQTSKIEASKLLFLINNNYWIK